jgi:uncharacterized protein
MKAKLKSKNMIYSPLKQNERIEFIDALRGFALFGILMVNLLYMYAPMSQIMLGAKPDASTEHIIAESFIKFFFEGKFYVIFSMLFGFGFFIFLKKSEGETNSSLSVFKRRLFFLLLFGISHITLLWVGDVLLYYALFGFILILFRKSTDKKIIRWAGALIVLPTFVLTILTILVSVASQIPEAKVEMDAQFQQNIGVLEDLVDRATVVYSTGTFGEMVFIRFEEYFNLLSGSLLFFCPVILGMFLIGFWAARKGVLSNFMNNANYFRKIFWWGLSVGIVLNLLYTIAYRYAVASMPDGWSLLATSLHTFGGLSLGLCYISGIALLFIHGRAGLFVKYLVPIGRMALTNYLLQSISSALLFHSYGLGLYGKVEVWQGIVLAFTIFMMQIAFSRLWLNYFQFGPFEWLWRSLTYFKMQPMTKRQLEKGK